MMRVLFTVGLVAMVAMVGGRAFADPDVRVPPGTRTDDSGHLISGRGLRETTDFLAKELDRRGISVKQVGPTRTRGVEVVRFLSQTPATPWLAIHVLRTNGRTTIFFVPRSAT